MHILCIRYGSVLANTAVLCRLCVCLPIRGAHQWVLLQHPITLRRVFFIVECGIARFLYAIRVFEVRESSPSPKATFVTCAKFRFFRGLHCWASPWKNRVPNHPPSLLDVPGTACASGNGNFVKFIRLVDKSFVVSCRSQVVAKMNIVS